LRHIGGHTGSANRPHLPIISAMSEVRALLLTDVVDSTQLRRGWVSRLAALWAPTIASPANLLAVRRGRGNRTKTDGMLAAL